MKVNCQKFQKFLGITLAYSTRVQVNVTIMDYINEIPNSFDESDIMGDGTKSSAALSIIFKVYKDCKNLMRNKMRIFIT